MKKDNSSRELKIEIRRRLLTMVNNPTILDLFCGRGVMYAALYSELPYLGIDKKRIHNPEKYRRLDNRLWLKYHSVEDYNFFDLDAYGNPWLLALQLAKKKLPDSFALIITDGLPLRLKRSSDIGKIRVVSAIERIPRHTKIHYGFCFYEDMFQTFLSKFCEFSHTKPKLTIRGYNALKTVCYWGLLLELTDVKNKEKRRQEKHENEGQNKEMVSQPKISPKKLVS